MFPNTKSIVLSCDIKKDVRKNFLNCASLVAIGFVLSLSPCAYAQSVPTQAPEAQTPTNPPASADTQTVVVTGQKPQVSNKIDRRVYDVKNDPQSQTGTAADVMNNVPSVSVDTDGNVALRGNAQVQVLLNGKPSAMLSGESRAATIQSMSADDIDSVEVITNPSSQFRSDGGGVINIVTKRNRRLGNSGALIANMGTEGRYNSAVSYSSNNGKLTLNGGINTRHDGRKFITDTLRERINPTTLVHSTTHDNAVGKGFRDSLSGQAGFEYNMSDKDTLGANISYSKRNQDGAGAGAIFGYDDLGLNTSQTSRRYDVSGDQSDSSFRTTYEHRGSKEGEVLKAELRLSKTSNISTQAIVNRFILPVSIDLNERVIRDTDTNLRLISTDYTRPLENDASLAMGLEWQAEDNIFDNHASFITAGIETVNTNLTNRFEIKQSVSAAYVTYQRPFGKWTLLSGLRLEGVRLGLNQVTSHINQSQDYVRLHPSFHLSYPLSDKDKFKASYSHRLQKPQAQDLNPFVVYRDSLNVTSGNAALKPQEIDSFEVGLEHTTQAFSYTTSVYYRKSYHTISDFSTVLSNGVLLTTKQNSGEGQSGGFEYSMNVKPSKGLSYSFNANVFYAQLQNIGLGLSGHRSIVSYNGKANIDLNFSPKDRLQISGNFQGKTLTTQGSRSGVNTLNLGYRHQFTPKLSLNITGVDVFNSTRITTRTDTAFVHDVSQRQMMGRIFFIGLSYTLGKAGSVKANETLIPDRSMGQRPGGNYN